MLIYCCVPVLQKNEYSSDHAKIYSVHLTNVIGGVASECRQCALAAVDSESACVPCPPGHYMLNGTGVCQSCPSNTIIMPEQPIGKQACILCGPNTYSNEVSIIYLHKRSSTIKLVFRPCALFQSKNILCENSPYPLSSLQF